MDIKSCRQATIQGVKFLLSQQQADGSFTPVEHGLAAFHKIPYALAVMGQTERAARLCMYVTENYMDDEGDLVGHFPRTPLHQEFALLSNAWLVAGAQRLGQFGLALRGVDFLGSLQNPTTGGFFTNGPHATVDGDQDVLTTATCGLALLYGGRLDEAANAGKYLYSVFESQLTAAARMYFRTHKGSQLVTDVPEEQIDRYVISVGKPEQWYHVPGMAAGFLAKLYEATGERRHLETAQRYLNFADNCGPDRYASVRSGFLGWAASLLYAATGNANYRRIAIAVADGLMKLQLANGSWLQMSCSEDLTSDVVDGTAEGIICMTQILEGLVSGE